MIGRIMRHLRGFFEPIPPKPAPPPPLDPNGRPPADELRARMLQAQNQEVIPQITRDLEAIRFGKRR